MLFRPIIPEDIDQFETLVGQLGNGMGASLRIGREGLKQRIELSMESFTHPTSPFLFQFVLEDPLTRQLVGICGLESLNQGKPFYAFRLETEFVESKLLDFRKERHSLRLTEVFTGSTNLCSQFLLPKYRGRGLGKLLSHGRLLYAINFPQLFGGEIVAELRGNYDRHGNSPFLQFISKNFFKELDYEAYSKILCSGAEQEFLSLIPKKSLYTSFFPSSVRDSICTFHPETIANSKLLHRLGFRFTQHIGYSSGAPILRVDLCQLQTTLRNLCTEWQVPNSQIQEYSNDCKGSSGIDFQIRLNSDTATFPPHPTHALGHLPFG